MSTHILYRKTQVQIEQKNKIKMKFVKSGPKSVDRRDNRHLA